MPPKRANVYNLNLNIDKLINIFKLLSQINKSAELINNITESNYKQLKEDIEQAEALLTAVQNANSTSSSVLSPANASSINSLKDVLFDAAYTVFQNVLNIFSTASMPAQSTNSFVVADLKQMKSYWGYLVRNMMVYLKLLYTFKTYICNLYVTFAQRYQNEIIFLQKNFNPSTLMVDKDLTLNFWFSESTQSDDFTTLATLYTTTFQFLHNCFNNPKFTKSLIGSLADRLATANKLAVATTQTVLKRAVPLHIFDNENIDTAVLSDSGDMYFEKTITPQLSTFSRTNTVINEILKISPQLDCKATGLFDNYPENKDDEDTKIQPIQMFNLDYKLPVMVPFKQHPDTQVDTAVDEISNSVFLDIQENLEELNNLPKNKSLNPVFIQKLERIYQDLNEILDAAVENTEGLYRDMGIMPLNNDEIEELFSHDQERLENLLNIANTGKLMDDATAITMRIVPLLPAIAAKIKDLMFTIDYNAENLRKLVLALNSYNLLYSSHLNFHLHNLRTGSFMIQNFLPEHICSDYFFLIKKANDWYHALRNQFPEHYIQINGLVVRSLEEIILRSDQGGYFDNAPLLKKFLELNNKSIAELFIFSEYALYNLINHTPSANISTSFLKRKRNLITTPTATTTTTALNLNDIIKIEDREMEYSVVGTDDPTFYTKAIVLPSLSKNTKSGNNMIYQWLFSSFETVCILALAHGDAASQEKVLDILKEFASETSYVFKGSPPKRHVDTESIPLLLELNLVRLMLLVPIILGNFTYQQASKVATIEIANAKYKNIITDLVAKVNFVAKAESQYKIKITALKITVELDVLQSDVTDSITVDPAYYKALSEFGIETSSNTGPCGVNSTTPSTTPAAAPTATPAPPTPQDFPELSKYIKRKSGDYAATFHTLETRVDLAGKFMLLQRLRKSIFTTVSIHEVKQAAPSFCLTTPNHEATVLEILIN